MMDYEQLLERGMEKVPKDVRSGERFEIPKAKVMRAGARTIIMNFADIASVFRRDQSHFLKFLLKELATKGEVDGKRLIVLGNFSEDVVNKKIELYAKNYVLCPECKKPDTKLIKEGNYIFLKCEACGARHSVQKI